MFELNSLLTSVLDIIQGLGLDYLIPKAGVGGGIEAKETVDAVRTIRDVLIFVAFLAGIFGIGLAMAAQKFAV